MEIWVVAKGHPNYEVSSDGQVRNLKTGRVLKQFINSNGYCVLSIDGRSKRVHRLIAESFYDGDHSGLDVNHIDGDKKNNHISNLEFCTRSQNIKHSFKHGLSTSNLNDRLRRVGNSIMKEKCSKPVKVIETGIVYSSINECARATGCYPKQVRMCCEKQARSHHNLHFEYTD